MAALEKSLPTVGGDPQVLISHPPLPGNFPLADLQFKNTRGDFRPVSDTGKYFKLNTQLFPSAYFRHLYCKFDTFLCVTICFIIVLLTMLRL
jgi:hypothetical protein